jgi:hypothetical protein
MERCQDVPNLFTHLHKQKKQIHRYGVDCASSLQQSHGIVSEWIFSGGSFCLVSHTGLDGVPLEERTLDKYCKACILEIRSPKWNLKSNRTSNTVSSENV